MPDSRLHIAVDGRELIGHTTGVGRYLLEILRCWRDVDRHDFTIIAPATLPKHLEMLTNRFGWTVEQADRAGTVWEQWALPRALRRLRPDVLFAPGYTAPLLAPCPVVQTIHDVSFFAHPEWFSTREGMRRRWLTRKTGRRAATVLTVSEFSRGEIARYLDIPADRIVVAPNGPPPQGPVSTAPRKKMVLFVGSLFNRRRIAEMIEAFADVAKTVPEARMVLIGANRSSPRIDPQQLAEAAGVGGKVEWLGYADETVLSRSYDAARVFLFLSDYEGFAITPLEAIAHGVPPILLDTVVAREIYRDTARFVPPSRNLIAEALRELLINDAVHSGLVQSGRAALTRYSWQQSANIVLGALEQAAR